MSAKEIIRLYIELTKPRILTLVLVTTAIGYILGAGRQGSGAVLFYTLMGAGLVCGGSSALNQYLERDVDAVMLRTKNRPLPSRQLTSSAAFSFGVVLTLVGVLLLWWKVNLLTAFLSLLSAFLYVLVYTPLKRVTVFNTTIGAIPGALPPLGGWAAATNSLAWEGWILFAILFVWQHPHFYAIAWMFRNDYARAGFKMWPVVAPHGRSTFAQIQIFAWLLVPVSTLPVLTGTLGGVYLTGALVCGIAMAVLSLRFDRSRSDEFARKLLKATVYYLPMLLVFILADFGLF